MRFMKLDPALQNQSAEHYKLEESTTIKKKTCLNVGSCTCKKVTRTPSEGLRALTQKTENLTAPKP